MFGDTKSMYSKFGEAASSQMRVFIVSTEFNTGF